MCICASLRTQKKTLGKTVEYEKHQWCSRRKAYAFQMSQGFQIQSFDLEILGSFGKQHILK